MCFLLFSPSESSRKSSQQNGHDDRQSSCVVYDTNPGGRILNRFSKDVGTIDDVLPIRFLESVTMCLFSLLSFLVPAVTNYWLFLALLPILSIFMYYARYYLASSRELKRIEAIKCSPVYSHFTETIHGLEIIHISNKNKAFLERLERLVERAICFVLFCFIFCGELYSN